MLDPNHYKKDAALGIISGHIRDMWNSDEAVVLVKAGKTGENKGNLRRINLISRQAKKH